ncbi:SdrD B-like domain-containing protein [Kribbella deserti]|uniref:SdrD B-like domain-containing protein n=1 Tax=Kribbella deserti TaxID=1926257 RepID=A0ABV6QX20_9ACTN
MRLSRGPGIGAFSARAVRSSGPSGSRRSRRFAGATAALAVVAALFTTTAQPAAAGGQRATAATITVNVVNELTGNGSLDEAIEKGVAGIPVTVRNDSGATTTTNTNADGTATFADLAAGNWRVSAEIPAALKHLLPAPAHGDLASLTEFVNVADGATSTVTMGVWNPADYAQENPGLVLPIQANPERATDDRALVTFPYNSRDQAAPKTLATQAQIGATYGVAFDKARKRIFVGALTKRHTLYGPGGQGAIYVVPADGSSAPKLFATVPGVGGTAHDTANINKDAGMLDAPGKEGLGDLEISEDGKTLYAVNLATKSLVTFDATGESATQTSTTPIPAPDCKAAVDWRPFGLGYQDGQLYVGGVCSAETTGARADLKAVVYASANGTSFTQKLVTPLDFERGMPQTGNARPDVISHWNPWLSTFSPEKWGGEKTPPVGNVVYPSPMLSDIAFDRDGSMILGFRDRFADQYGANAFSPVEGDYRWIDAVSGGDIYRACKEGDAYVFECRNNATPANSGNQAETVREFFPGEFWNKDSPHQETALGGLAYAKQQPDIASTVFDPIHVYSAGVSWFDRVNGKGAGNDGRGRGLEIAYRGTDDNRYNSTNGLGKSGGLGDLEVLADLAPIQIGNRVWFDQNKDGTQGPGEACLPGTGVSLVDASGATVGSTTTDAKCEYYFGGIGRSEQITPGAKYTVKFNACSADTSKVPGTPDASTLVFTQADAGDDTTIDSDVTPGSGARGCEGSAKVTAPTVNGESDHTIDAGLTALCSVGDFVWLDADRDGVQDDGEAGVEGVKVSLRNPDGTPATGADGQPVPEATTGADGAYRFAQVPCAEYIVRFVLPAGSGYSFTTVESGDDSAKDSNPTPSLLDPLTADTAPFTVSGDNPSDVTIDAGVVTQQLCAMGDYVWRDLDRDGVQDEGEPAVSGVKVELLNPDGTPAKGADGSAVPATTTGDDGKYAFGSLPCQQYIVRFTLPDGTKDGFTKPLAGTDRAVDSNPKPAQDNPKIGTTPVFTLNPESNQQDLTIDAGVTVQPECATGDFVWRDRDRDGVQDAGEPGVGGVKVELLNPDGSPAKRPDGSVVPAATTGTDGKYLFTGVPCKQYIVRFTLPASGDDDFTKPRAGTDRAKDSNVNTPREDPKIGTTPVFTLDPGTNPKDLSIDAGVVVATNKLGDYVWIDSDGDGVQDPKEKGVSGVRVCLLDKEGESVDLNGDGKRDCVTTARDGRYLFDNLPDGEYKVRFNISKIALPYRRCGLTVADAGNDDKVDSDADLLSKTTPVTKLGVGRRADLTLDAGVCVGNQLGDRVWVDKDRDGIQDDGEPGLPKVRVCLLDSSGRPVDADRDGLPDCRVTDKEGEYLFSGLRDGSYRVEFDLGDLSGQYTDCGLTKVDAGDDDSVDSDAHRDTMRTAAVKVGPGHRSVRTVDAGVCTVATVPGDDDLADTGTSVTWPLAGLGLLLLLAGAVALLLARRRAGESLQE